MLMLTTMLLRLTITVNSVHVDNDSVGVQRSYQMRSDLHNVDDNDNVENDRSYKMIFDLNNVNDHLAKRDLERTQVRVDGQEVSHL